MTIRRAAAIAFFSSLFGGIALADEPLHQEVTATLAEDGTISGTTTLRVVSDTSTIRLWVYADRLGVAPGALDQRNARWIFPREIDTTDPELEVRVDGRTTEVRWERGEAPEGRDTRGGDVIVNVGTPGEHVVTVRFRYRLPERFGRLGRVGARLTMTGPWYPLLVGADGATRFDAPHEVVLRVPPDHDVVAPGARREGNVVRVERRGSFVPFALAPTWHVRERALADGFRLRIRSHVPLYRAPEPDAQGPESIHDLARIDVVGELARVATDVVQTLRLAQVPVSPRTFDVVLTPSRTELAATAPGVVLVSDRIYEIFPLAQIQMFHDRAIRRALFRAAIETQVDTLEPARDRDWSEDLRAVVLSDLDEVRRQGSVQSAQDLIGWAGFHPAVDQLLYAPQVAFVDVYFGTVHEPDPFRDAPGRSRSPTARGRRLIESARDVMSEEDHRGWSRALVALRATTRSALQEVDAEAAERLPTWLRAPATHLNYRLGEISSERTESGYRHRIVVHRDGDDRREPVQVRVVDDDGNSAMGTWDAAGPRGVVEVETPDELDDVQIDPRGRVVQSPRVADGHPRRDDGNRLPWRPPLLQGFNVAASTEGVFIGLLDFALRRRYDLENTVSLRLTTGPRASGGLLRYTRGVGRKRDTNSRIGFINGGIGFDRLHARFADDGVGGWRTSLLLSGGYSTQRYFLDPRKGSILVGSVRGGLTRREDGRTTYTLSPAIRGNLTLQEGLRATTVLVAGAGWVFGDPLPNERPGLGGRFFLRGYQTDEAVGRGRVFFVVEQRFTPTAFSDLNWNLLHLAWIRQIQLALFAGGGAVFLEEDGRDVIGGIEVGGGIRVHFEYGGIQPGVLALDLAAPLIRRESDRRIRPPLTFIFGFEQYF